MSHLNGIFNVFKIQNIEFDSNDYRLKPPLATGKFDASDLKNDSPLNQNYTPYPTVDEKVFLSE